MEIKNETDFTIVCISSCLTVLLSVIGYGTILSAVHRGDLRKSVMSTAWLKSLCCSDMIFAIHVAMNAYATYLRRWPFGEFGFTVYAFTALCMGLVSISSNAVMLVCRAEERHPQRPLGVFTTSVPVAWLSAAAICVLYYLSISPFTITPHTFGCLINLDDEGVLPKCIIIVISLGWFLLPMYQMGKACLVLGNKRNWLVPITVLSFYTPFALCALLSVTSGLDRFYYNIIWIHLFPKFLVAINPYLQIYLNDDLRAACKNIFTGEIKKGV